jgi:hypothetical protein
MIEVFVDRPGEYNRRRSIVVGEFLLRSVAGQA